MAPELVGMDITFFIDAGNADTGRIAFIHFEKLEYLGGPSGILFRSLR